MSRIAYVDHSFHAKTQSNVFLSALLKKHGHDVDLFWCDRWKGGKGVSIDAVAAYDAVIMFQVQCTGERRYRDKHPNVTFVPMLDAYGNFKTPQSGLYDDFKYLHGSKVLSFSKGIHYISTTMGIYSFPVRYFQPPVGTGGGISGLHGFFWLRHEDQVSWPIVRQLISTTSFDSFHVHIAPDPGSPKPVLPTVGECTKFSITTSNWFENKSDFLQVLSKANVFFASRSVEGIGQSFLEAMSRGACVVAPDNGTMNEYIVNGVNGILYNQENITPIDFSCAAQIASNALLSVQAGHAHWISQEKDVVNFLLAPSDSFYERWMGLREACEQFVSFEESKTSFLKIFSLRRYIRKLRVVRYFEFLWLPLWRKFKIYFKKS